MQAHFYTNVKRVGNFVNVIGYDKHGNKVKYRDRYSPSSFILTDKKTDYRTIYGQSVDRIQFGDLSDYEEFYRKYKDVDNFDVYGYRRIEFTYISDKFEEDLPFDLDKVRIINFDIEVRSDKGFPKPRLAEHEIISVTFSTDEGYYILGTKDYTPSKENVVYKKCRDEADLLESVIVFFKAIQPDALTGWNTTTFDIPYLVNRIENVLGERRSHELSPWGDVKEISIKTGIYGEEQSFDIVGISNLDYLDLYKKFTFKNQESYSLDYISKVELGKQKIEYDGTLYDLYLNDYEQFIEYNMRDVELVNELDEKMKLLSLVMTMAYESKINFRDTFKQVRIWETLIFNEMRKSGLVFPPMKKKDKVEQFKGAYVKEPIPGRFNWITSFDVTSMYPNVLIQLNISPEKISTKTIDKTPDQIIQETLLGKKQDVPEGHCLAANGTLFKNDSQGIIPAVVEKMYNDRIRFRNEMKKQQKLLAVEENPEEIERLKKSIAKYNNLQMVRKIAINSAYGTMGSPYFGFYDLRMAEAITYTAQLVIKWSYKKFTDYFNKVCDTNEDWVVAGDTDSAYLSLEKFVQKIFPGYLMEHEQNQICDFLSKVCDDKLDSNIKEWFEDLSNNYLRSENRIEMKREVIANTGIWVAKKKYVLNVMDEEGLRFDEPKTKVTGIEAIKSSTPEICRKKIKDCLAIILNSSNDDLVEYIAEFKKEFCESPPQVIAFPRGVNGLARYKDKNDIYGKGTPIHVRASLLYNFYRKKFAVTKQYPEIQEGDKIRYIQLMMPNPIRENVVAFSEELPVEFGLNKFIDYKIQFQKTFLDPLKQITDKINWELEREANSLSAFF